MPTICMMRFLAQGPPAERGTLSLYNTCGLCTVQHKGICKGGQEELMRNLETASGGELVVCAGHAVPDDSDSEDDSDGSPTRSRADETGGMAIPDAAPQSPPKEKERDRPKEGRDPDFGMTFTVDLHLLSVFMWHVLKSRSFLFTCQTGRSDLHCQHESMLNLRFSARKPDVVGCCTPLSRDVANVWRRELPREQCQSKSNNFPWNLLGGCKNQECRASRACLKQIQAAH